MAAKRIRSKSSLKHDVYLKQETDIQHQELHFLSIFDIDLPSMTIKCRQRVCNSCQ